jgi:hypothetical protein
MGDRLRPRTSPSGGEPTQSVGVRSGEHWKGRGAPRVCSRAGSRYPWRLEAESAPDTGLTAATPSPVPVVPSPHPPAPVAGGPGPGRGGDFQYPAEPRVGRARSDWPLHCDRAIRGTWVVAPPARLLRFGRRESKRRTNHSRERPTGLPRSRSRFYSSRWGLRAFLRREAQVNTAKPFRVVACAAGRFDVRDRCSLLTTARHGRRGRQPSRSASATLRLQPDHSQPVRDSGLIDSGRPLLQQDQEPCRCARPRRRRSVGRESYPERCSGAQSDAEVSAPVSSRGEVGPAAGDRAGSSRQSALDRDAGRAGGAGRGAWSCG